MLLRMWEAIKYWYFRYLVVTELYMVERWERHTIHTIFACVFSAVWYFNQKFLLAAVSQLTSRGGQMEYNTMRLMPTSLT